MADYNINEEYSLMDKAKATYINGVSVLPIIRTLNLKVDDFYRDVPFKPCNRGTKHVLRRANEMVESQTRRLYQGVKATKMSTQIVVEDVVPKERVRSIDEMALVGLDEAGRVEELKQQDKSHIRRLGEDMVRSFFNGGVSEDSAEIRGLKQRLNTISDNSLENVDSCGHSSADNNSRLFIIEWDMDGDQGCFGIYPSGWMRMGELGVKSVDLGKQKVVDPNDTEKTYMAHEARHYGWTGIAVGDNLKIACLANINTDEDGSNNLISGHGSRKIMKLLNHGHFDRARTRIYCNEDIKTQFDILGNEKSNLSLTSVEVFGRWVDAFRKIPIRVLDSTVLTNSESVVS